MTVLNGIDRFVNSGFAEIRGQRVGVLCNQASITKSCVHLIDLLLPAHHSGEFTISACLGPQHGIWGHTQDNMIEWEGYVDPRTGLPFFSLYGEVREPRPEWLAGINTLIVDLPDIGSRYYTFMWTMVHCMAECERQGIRMLVLDRVNPIGGTLVEGSVLEPQYSSFVGLHPLPMRHGMTLGELARHFRRTLHPDLNLDVIEVEGWNRSALFNKTDLTWAVPSPNMPTPDTALVYPGACLIEGTQLSEGRGTTRPFEIIGAPFIDGWKLASELNSNWLPGVVFRPIQFQPTFQKFAGQVCGGVFVHVFDQNEFRPVLTYLALIRDVIRLWPDDFKWLDPPYEYVWDRMPIDILLGNGRLRPMLESGAALDEFIDECERDERSFADERAKSLIYPDP